MAYAAKMIVYKHINYTTEPCHEKTINVTSFSIYNSIFSITSKLYRHLFELWRESGIF